MGSPREEVIVETVEVTLAEHNARLRDLQPHVGAAFERRLLGVERQVQIDAHGAHVLGRGARCPLRHEAPLRIALLSSTQDTSPLTPWSDRSRNLSSVSSCAGN